MPRKAGGTRRKRRTHKIPEDARENDKIPRSFVFRRGKVPVAVRDLIPQLRTAFMPHTAMRLKEHKSNNIRDYISIATQLGVTHFWIFSATQKGVYMRLGRVPQGPTLTFKVVAYTLSTDVQSIQRRPTVLQDKDFDQPPLLVLNNFSTNNKKDPVVQIMSETFKHSFPPIDVNAVHLNSLRRVLLVNRDSETGRVDIRHYALKVQQAGLSRPVRKMVNKKRIPKMANLADVSQLMDGAPGVFSSDSEAEENTDSLVQLSQSIQKVKKGANSTVKLVEVGPRLTLELMKIQGGMCGGAVLYHKFVTKSKEDVEADEKRIGERKELKRKRREEQDANVQRKQDVKKAKKERHRKNIEARIKAEQEAEALENDEDADSES